MSRGALRRLGKDLKQLSDEAAVRLSPASLCNCEAFGLSDCAPSCPARWTFCSAPAPASLSALPGVAQARFLLCLRLALL